MFDGSLGLAAAAISVQKKNAEELVIDVSRETFGDTIGSEISKHISERYQGGTTGFQIKQVVQSLGNMSVSLPADCRECELRESRLLTLLDSQKVLNTDLQTRLLQASSDSLELESVRQQVKDQEAVISSLNKYTHELKACRLGVAEKERQLDQVRIDSTLLRDRDNTIHNLEQKIIQRDVEIQKGNHLLSKSSQLLNDQDKQNLQKHAKDLAEKDVTIQRLGSEINDKKAQLGSLESRLSSSESNGSRLLEEKKTLESKYSQIVQSMEGSSDHVIDLDNQMKSLVKQLEERDSKITDLNTSMSKLRGENLSLVNSRRDDLASCNASTKSEHEEHVSEMSKLRQEHADKLSKIIDERNQKEQSLLQDLNEQKVSCESDKSQLRSEYDELSTRNKKREIDFVHLAEQNRSLQMLRDEENEKMDQALRVADEMIKDETIAKKASMYLLKKPGERDPTSKYLNEKYGTLFLIKKKGRSSMTPMSTEPGSMGRMNPVDLEIFWKDVFRNSSNPKKIWVRTGGSDIQVSLLGTHVFKTWVEVRKRNSCNFTMSASFDEKMYRAKEFLLFLYIIHLEGLFGDGGVLVIPPVSQELDSSSRTGSSSLTEFSSFNFSDMFRW